MDRFSCQSATPTILQDVFPPRRGYAKHYRNPLFTRRIGESGEQFVEPPTEPPLRHGSDEFDGRRICGVCAKRWNHWTSWFQHPAVLQTGARNAAVTGKSGLWEKGIGKGAIRSAETSRNPFSPRCKFRRVGPDLWIFEKMLQWTQLQGLLSGIRAIGEEGHCKNWKNSQSWLSKIYKTFERNFAIVVNYVYISIWSVLFLFFHF